MSETNLETDQKFNVSCSVRDVFPAPRFNLSLAGHPLPFHVTEDGLRAVAEVSHAQQGRFEVVCSVWVGRKERWQQALVHVYSKCSTLRRVARWERRPSGVPRCHPQASPSRS